MNFRGRKRRTKISVFLTLMGGFALLLFSHSALAQTGTVGPDASRGSDNDGVDEGPPEWAFYYLLIYGDGTITEWSYTGDRITDAEVIPGSAAEAHGWTLDIADVTSTKVTFRNAGWNGADSPLAGFAIIGTNAGVGTWTVHSSSGSIDGSLAVELSTFTATRTSAGVFIRWRTESEVNNMGFNIYRVEGEKVVKVNQDLIIGHGSTPVPHDYEFLDRHAPKGNIKYFIEDIDIEGERDVSAIIPVQDAKGKLALTWGKIKAQR